MQIIEHSPRRLILQNRSRVIGIVFALGASLWVMSVMGVAVWGAFRLSTDSPLPTFYALRMFGLAVVFMIGALFSTLGWLTGYNIVRGITCDFDRDTETVTITQPRKMHMERTQHSIYGVSHAHIESNQELNVYALYLVLRSGQRISLGVCNAFERDHAEQVVQSVRAFLAMPGSKQGR